MSGCECLTCIGSDVFFATRDRDVVLAEARRPKPDTPEVAADIAAYSNQKKRRRAA